MSIQIGHFFCFLAFILFGISIFMGWYGKELISKPKSINHVVKQSIEPEAFRLLQYLYQIQVKFGLDKLIISRDGMLMKNNENIIQTFFNVDKVDEILKKSFEKLVHKIPGVYLKNIPETLWDSPFVLLVTEEGIQYIKSKS